MRTTNLLISILYGIILAQLSGCLAQSMMGEPEQDRLVYDDTATESSETNTNYTDTNEDPHSTFSIDVDTASYTLMRSVVNNGRLPVGEKVRLEEYVNYFNYYYSPPLDDKPFSIHTELAETPWDKDKFLLKIGIKGKEFSSENRGSSNLVFLIDTSGSMGSPNKLPLAKEALNLLVDQLTAQDSIAIVTYASGTKVILESTNGDNKKQIKEAIDTLTTGGATNGEGGISQAYSQATLNYQSNGSNRVILVTDGDFNVGKVNGDELVALIREKSEGGIYLSALGFGMSYNDHLMEQLTNEGNGNFAYIDNLNEAKKALVDDVNGTLMTIAKDVKIQMTFDENSVYQYRLLGYNNRRLADNDFDNDQKDAGDIGAGHTVTAFYELALHDGVEFKPNAHLAKLALRYKEPDGYESMLIERNVNNKQQNSLDFYFAAAVAQFALLLDDSVYNNGASIDNVLMLAKNNKGSDLYGYRQEFIGLVEKAKPLLKKKDKILSE